MSKELEDKCRELQSTIEALQNENSLLAEKTEETLLISKVAQSINSIDDSRHLLETILEEVSVLTNIPFCSCCSLEGNLASPAHTYAAFAVNDCLDTEITLSSKVLHQLNEEGYCLLTNGPDFNNNLTIDFKSSTFAPYASLLCMFDTPEIPRGVFVFFDDEANKIKLSSHNLLLQNIINMVVAKLDKISLIEELQDVNARLDDIVTARTISLAKSNKQLSCEIQERRQSEQSLRWFRNFLSNIIDSMPSMLIAVDIEGRVTQWNQRAEQSTGIAAAKAQGMTIAELFPRKRVKIDDVRESIQTKQIKTEQKRPFLTKAGTRYEDITIYPLATDGLEGAVIRIDDVTEQVHLQETMIQSEKMISVGGLAAGMAHEINNPLGVIISAAQMISRKISPESVKNKAIAQEMGVNLEQLYNYLTKANIHTYLAGIQEAVERAAKIVRNMLDFSRKAESIRSEYDLHDILEKALELASSDYDLKKKYDFRSIHILREYDKASPMVRVIKTEIEQVFLNLYRNAAHAIMEKSSNDQTPTIALRTGFAENCVWVEVEDNGCGMDEVTRKRVFEPFFTTKEVGMGTGLGLSVSYFIITNNHNGEFSVDSSPNEGAKFTIRLPQS